MNERGQISGGLVLAVVGVALALALADRNPPQNPPSPKAPPPRQTSRAPTPTPPTSTPPAPPPVEDAVRLLASQDVGERGGTLAIPTRDSELRVPPGALTEGVELRATTLADPLFPPHGYQLLTQPFRLEPEGQTFARAATLTLKTPRPEADMGVFLASYDPEEGTWDIRHARWNPSSQRFEAQLEHFSIWTWVKAALGIHDEFRQPGESEFCLSCHEMDHVFVALQTTGHANVACAQCHTGRGVGGFVKAKFDGLRHMAVHTKNWALDTESTSFQLSARMFRTTNFRCRECHLKDYTKNPSHLTTVQTVRFAPLPDARRERDNGPGRSIPCTTCHRAVPPSRDLATPPLAVFTKPGECLDCHHDATPERVLDWTRSAHARAGVHCATCHGNDHAAMSLAARSGEPLVADTTCAACHADRADAALDTSHRHGDYGVALSAHLAKRTGAIQALEGNAAAERNAAASSSGASLLSAECAKCHGPVRGGLAGYAFVPTRQSELPWLTPGDPDRSFLLRKIDPSHQGTALQPDEIATLRTWIEGLSSK